MNLSASNSLIFCPISAPLRLYFFITSFPEIDGLYFKNALIILTSSLFHIAKPKITFLSKLVLLYDLYNSNTFSGDISNKSFKNIID